MNDGDNPVDSFGQTDMQELWRLNPAAARHAEQSGVGDHHAEPGPDDVVICTLLDARHPLVLPDNAIGGCGVCGRQVQFRPLWIGRPNPRRCMECALAEMGPVQRATLSRALYRNEAFPDRNCDRCTKPYRGPAVYCSWDCAVADA